MESHRSFWLTDAEDERLNDVPVAGGEVQRVGTEGDFPVSTETSASVTLVKGSMVSLMLKVSSVPLSVALELPLPALSW